MLDQVWFHGFDQNLERSSCGSTFLNLPEIEIKLNLTQAKHILLKGPQARVARARREIAMLLLVGREEQ